MYLFTWRHEYISLLLYTSLFISFIPTDIHILYAGITSFFLIEILPIRRKPLSNQSINQSINQSDGRINNKNILFLSEIKSQNSGKITNLFHITITENSEFAFGRNCL